MAGLPHHVQMSSLRFSCFSTFWRHCTCSYTCVGAAVRDRFGLFRHLRVHDGRTDLHAHAADLIVAFTKTARFGRSLNEKVDKNRRCDDYSGQLVELTETM